MDYRFAPERDYADFAPGRALRGGKGRPNFPVRLALELYGRGAATLGAEEVRLWDPLCGTGSLLLTAALLGEPAPRCVFGSDADAGAAALAEENLALLRAEGCARRRAALEERLRGFGRESYAEALESLGRLEALAAARDVACAAFVYDIFDEEAPPLPQAPNLVVCDLPYGALADWSGAAAEPEAAFLTALFRRLAPGAVAAVCMDKRQRLRGEGFVRLEKGQVGKRRFELYRRG